jgi:hypothetical protein
MDAKQIIRKVRFLWVGGLTIALTIFFFIDLTMYFYIGEETTLSATLRSVLAVDDIKTYWRYLFSFLCGVWFSHLTQFGAKADGG